MNPMKLVAFIITVMALMTIYELKKEVQKGKFDEKKFIIISTMETVAAIGGVILFFMV